MIGACSLGVYEKAMPSFISWEERLKAARQAGFDFVEMSIDESDERLNRLDMGPEWKDAVLTAMQKADIRIESICLSAHRRFPMGSQMEAYREKSLEILEKSIVLARDLGIRTIQLAGYDVYYEASTEKTKQLFRENLKKAVDYASSHHVMLAFETMETPFLNTVQKCMNYVEEISSPWLQIYPDSGNLFNAAYSEGIHIKEDLERGRGHIISMHLKESSPGFFREVEFGKGMVDFPMVINQAMSLGIRRFVEEFWYDENWPWITQLEEGYQFMYRQFLVAEQRKENAI